MGFLATPHLSESDDDSVRVLALILRYECAFPLKGLFAREDVTWLAWNAIRFEEMRLNCPMLSAYETVTSRIRISLRKRTVKVFVRSRTPPQFLTGLQLVDKDLARSPSGDGKFLVPVDTVLSDVFRTASCLVHRHVESFLTDILNNWQSKDTRIGHGVILEVEHTASRQSGMPLIPMLLFCAVLVVWESRRLRYNSSTYIRRVLMLFYGFLPRMKKAYRSPLAKLH